MTNRRILIAGATGIVGAAAAEHFHRRPGWEVVTLSRRQPSVAGVPHVPADLTDAAATRQALRSAGSITHVLYAALYEKPNLAEGWTDPEQIETNVSMLRNLLDAAEGASDALQHLTVLQGGKAYGSHVRAVPVPAKERWPRGDHSIFYWQQEDLLRERAAAASWSFTILRPQMILGHAVASPMNVIAALGAYASVMHRLGRDLSFPGGGRHVNACSDSRLIARAVEFAGTEPAAQGETFNVVNGDVLVWHDIWPSLAEFFGMSAGAPSPMALAEEMPKLSHVWDDVVESYALQPYSMEQLISTSWSFADIALGAGKERPNDRVMSPIKLRQAGFADCQDTEDAILYWLSRLQSARLIPRL